MEQIIENAQIEELRLAKASKSFVHLLGIIAILVRLGKVDDTFFKRNLGLYLQVAPIGSFEELVKKLEQILGVNSYNWWKPVTDGKDLWTVRRAACDVTNAFEAGDEESALIHLEVVLELKTNRIL